MYQSISPITGSILETYDTLTNDQMEGKTALADQAFRSWSKVSLDVRKTYVTNLGRLLRERISELSELMTQEMGKVISEARSEVEKCAWLCDEYVDHVDEWLAPQRIPVDRSEAEIHYVPQGLVLAIMPWNFPLWQVLRCAVPALLSGNVVLLKHASSVPQCAAAIQDLFTDAQFPEGCFTNLFVNRNQIQDLIADERVRGISLTGSGPAGRSVYQQAAAQLKPVVLELGGNDPYLVLKDADVDLAVRECVKGRMLNAGQSCIGAKRFIVERPVYGEFLRKFRSAMEQFSFDKPTKASTRLGPLSSFKHREELHTQVLKTVADGSHLLIGGYIPTEVEGAYYPPTILTEVEKGHLAYDQELFGPVAVVMRVEDVEQAIQVANDTSFGLGAAIFTKNKSLAERLAIEDLDAGSVFINEFVKSHPLLPFGGVKHSGVGRELAADGLQAFCNKKTILYSG